MGTVWTSEPQLVEAQDPLEVSEQHLDFLPLTPRDHVGVGLGRCRVPCPGRPRGWSAGPCGRGAWGSSVASAHRDRNRVWWPGAHEAFGIDAGPWLMELPPVVHQLLAGRADVEVALVVVGEVGAAERAVPAGRLVEHRDVRLDALLVHQPASMAAEP